MGYTLQKLGLFLFQFKQAVAQPVEAFTQLFQVTRAGNLHALLELPLTEAAYRLVYLFDRPGDQYGKEYGQHQGRRHQRPHRREDDRRVQRHRRRRIRWPGPDRPQRTGEILALPVARSREGVNLSSLVPGDLDQDGDVDTEDLNALLGSFGTAAGWTGGDFTFVGIVNDRDASILAAARERIIASASRSVVFLQGAYGFTESKTGRPLRFMVSQDGSPVIGSGGMPTFTAAGKGPEVEIFYTGTGFVATEDGRIVTNHHVAEPWLFDEEAKALIEQGLVPVMRRFIGYLPGQNEPFDVSLIAASETADVAVLRCQNLTAGLPALNLDDQALDVGDEVVVLGYPTGIRAMIARSQREILPLLEARGEVDFWEVARVLADGGHIAPLATRGIVGQITAASVVYDADTTHGGSGGPVISLDGAVVAVNAAILTSFAGSNLGVPAAEALRLLQSPPDTPGDQDPVERLAEYAEP